MKKSLIISLVTLVFAANLSCYAADEQRIELTSPKDKQDATAMENAFFSYVTQKSECLKKKQGPPSSCKHLTGFYQAKEVYKDTIKQHPSWRDKSLHWNTPKGHLVYLNSFKISFQ